MILNFTGDVILSDLFDRYKCGIGTRMRANSFDPFCHTRTVFKNGDINVINLESVISSGSKLEYPFSEIMRSDLTAISLLKNNYINAVNLSNNHSIDHGEEAYFEMKDNLIKSGIAAFGSHRNSLQRNPISIIFDGKTFSFMGFYLEESKSPPERSRLLDQITKLASNVKDSSKLLIISLHWGSEYTNKPFLWMIDAGKSIIDAGADVVYGHHSHTYQGVTKYKNGIFAPSLGNFIFDDLFRKNRVSAILQIDYNNDYLNFRTIPIFIGKDGAPVPCRKSEKYIDERNNALSEAVSGNICNALEWDKNVLAQVNAGHRKNRLKIRSRILFHPLRYWQFVINKYVH